MAKAQNPIPADFSTITAHLTVKGCADYIEFLKRAFNAVELMRAPGPGGKLMHATVRIGDSVVMLNDDFSAEFGQPPIAQGRLPLVLHFYVPDADDAFAQALAAGCEVAFPLADQFWGARYGQVKDPFGFTWAIATHIEDLTLEEVEARQAAASGGGGH
jgi:PhnB protein